MDSANHMRQAIDLAVATIRGADVARYDDRSPCADYTVGDLVNHLAFGLLLAHRSATREPWNPAWTAADRTPFLEGRPEREWAHACAEQATKTARAWAEQAAWDGESHMGGSPMPAGAIGSMMTAEFAVHAWDVAAATGQPLEVAPALGEVVLDGVTAMAPAGRDGGWFGPEVDVPIDAPAFERALAASGRDPRWMPERAERDEDMDSSAINARVIEQFRAGAEVEGMHRDRLLLLTTVGRRTGREHTTPMMFHRDGGRVLVVASNAGAPRHPDWYLNLVADPAVTVEVGDEPGGPYRATASTIVGEERTALWEMLKQTYPFFADHEAAVERTIPVVALTRTG